MSERALTGNAADVKQAKKAKQYDRLREERRKANLEATLKTPYGRAVLCDILDECGLYDDVYFPGQPDGTNRFLGRRSVGLLVFAEIESIEPGAYLKMRLEKRAFEQAFSAEPTQDDSKPKPVQTEEDES
jgi:hypothetical protein